MKTPPSKIRDDIEYLPESGFFIRRTRRGKFAAGSVAGTLQTNGDGSHRYIAIKYGGKEYAGHRLAWWFMTGVWSDKHIDHKDGDSLDNRWSNLREADQCENQWNKAAYSCSSNGMKGVTKYQDGWRARISVRGRRICLGKYPTPEAASFAYQQAARQQHGEFVRA